MKNVIEEKEWKMKKQQRLIPLFITAVMLAGSLSAFYKTLSVIENRIGILWLVIASVAGVISCEAAWNLKRVRKFWVILAALPWLAGFVFTGFHGYFNGMKVWINGMIHRWNQVHEGGAALFGGNLTTDSLRAFCIMMAILMGQVIWLMVMNGHTVTGWIWGMLWVILMLWCDLFSSHACSMIFCGLVGMYIAGRKMQMNRIAVCWFAGLMIVCMTGMFMIPQENVPSVERMRTQAKEQVHEIRYGEEKLPAGDLSLADTFQKDTQKMLTVTSAQEKNLYLKAFIGGIYRNGIWETMPDSEYGGEEAGMLQWLENHKFDPLTQTADYYKIGKNSDVETNKIRIDVSGASRDYFYATGTLKSTLNGKLKTQKDYGLLTTGLFGERQYSFSEMSGNRPSELMVADAWVQSPKTKEQKEYCKAEAVYRDFVYKHYTTVDKTMYQKVEEIFWKDYNSESDGIYSALNQIRNVLKEDYTYTRTPKVTDGSDPVTEFLETSHTGNAMLYTSAAVEAFRVHGIPARYVEGYYVPSTAIASSTDGHVLLSGEDMHAWVEVYFDGIGWLPVDVTPGYYYDVAALQNMVNLPEQTQKNAALKDNSFGGKQSSDLGGSGKKALDKVKKHVWDVAKIVLGIAAVLVICVTIALVILEAGELYMMYRLRKNYRKAEKKEKILLLEREIFLVLHCMGVEAHLGWKTKETDRLLQRKTEQMIEAGAYIRMSELLEKQIYGDITLERFEEHTVERFLKDLLEAGEKCDWKTRWKIHQRHFGFAIMER